MEKSTGNSERRATSHYLTKLTILTADNLKPYDLNGDGKISPSDDITKDNMITKEDKDAYVKPIEMKKGHRK